MKKRLSILLIILLCCAMFGLAGCSMFDSQDATDPKQVMQDAYGSKQFTISFYAENLSEPLADMTYTAYDMPTLPTPERVGYIFEGWYLDKNYTTRYSDGILYLYMSDVVLYAKWSEEDFTTDGTYDIELSCSIEEDTLSLGASAEEYGWKDLSQDLLVDECYIEKSEDGLQLKISYNIGVPVPYGYAATYRIVPDSSMGSSIYIAESITPDNETVHSVFFNIDDFDITQPIYLNVVSYNWETELDNAAAVATRASYTVRIDITRLIGFSQSYVDPDVEADEGYYLVKTHFYSMDGDSSMMESYNSVYAYVYVDDEGNYTLIKSFLPYSGLTESTDYTTFSHYYSRDMTFAPLQLYYRITVPDDWSPTTDDAAYYADYYNGEQYGDFEIEYHADTGMYYQIFDLGGTFKTAFVIKGATTGFVEQAFGMGAYNVIMTLDYDHIVKVSEVDYTPLTGDAYVYGDSVAYYAGELDDLNSQNVAKSATEENGISNDMINLFYSATSASQSTSQRVMHSFRMSVTPTTATNASSVKDSRYKVAQFDISYQVYGYDPADGKGLYADSMTVTSFGTNGMGLRQTLTIVNGKSLSVGDTVWFADLFTEKVSVEGFGGSQVTVYTLSGSSVDWSSGVQLSATASYTFTQNVAVQYTWEGDGGTEQALVYLMTYSDPVISIRNTDTNTYSAYGHTVGDVIYYPIVTYTFMGATGSFIGTYYPSDDNTMVADPTSVAVYAISDDGVYSLAYGIGTLTFTMSTNHMVAVYECRNQFGESYFYELDFYAQSQTTYSITEDGASVASGNVTYDGATGERRAISVNYNETRTLNALTDLDEIEARVYHLSYGSVQAAMDVTSCTLYAAGTTVTITQDIFSSLREALGQNSYAIFTLTYQSGEDSLTFTYAYNLKFDGANSFSFLSDAELFTGYRYTIEAPSLVEENGNVLAVGELTLYYYNNGRYSSALSVSSVEQYGNTYYVTLTRTGQYRLEYSVTRLAYDKQGNNLFGGNYITLRFYQELTAYDGTGDVTITYVTDTAHPFAEGISYSEVMDENGEVTGYAHTVTYNLTQSILSFAQTDSGVSNFAYDGTDRLFGWFSRSDYTIVDATQAYRRGTLISDFIGEFGCRNVTLYALWDEGMSVQIDRQEEVTGLSVLTQTKWLSSGSSDYGLYTFTLQSLSFTAPTGYVHTGWLVNGVLYASDAKATFTYRTNQTVQIEVVLAKEYTVRYVINSTYGNRMGDSTVVEGECIALPDVTAKVGYTFVEWRLVTSYTSNTSYTLSDTVVGADTVIDDSNAVCAVNNNQAVVIVAVFMDAEGELAW